MPDDHLIVHHPKLKPEGLVYVLQSDWSRLKSLVNTIRDPSFFWGNLAFTVLGCGVTILASVGTYHATVDSAKMSGALLGCGYTVGVLSLVISVLLYAIHRNTLPGASSSRSDIQQVIGIIEAKLVQAQLEIEDAPKILEIQQPPTHERLEEMKRIAFRSLSKEK